MRGFRRPSNLMVAPPKLVDASGGLFAAAGDVNQCAERLVGIARFRSLQCSFPGDDGALESKLCRLSPGGFSAAQRPHRVHFEMDKWRQFAVKHRLF